MPTDDEEGGTPRPPGGGPDELKRLSERVAQLEAHPARARGHPLRTTAATVLILIAAILSPAAVVAVWAHDQVSDTDRYVATVAPLAHNPEVQDAAADRVARTVVQQIDVKALIGQLSQAASEKGVPPRAADLINKLDGPITDGLTSLIHDVAHRLVTSDQFATLWTEGNRAAHNAVDKALTGQGGGTVQLQGDEVTVDLAPMIDKVKGRLTDAGLDAAARIPQVHTGFVIYSSPDLAKYKTWFRLLGIAGDWLPLIVAVIAAIGVFVAVNRRRALIGAALGILAAMAVLGVAIAVFRSFYLDHLPPDVSHGAAGAVYDALVHFLRQAVRAVGVLAAAVAIGAFVIGPSHPAVTLRDACSGGIAGTRRAADSAGFRAGPAERFTRRYKRWIGAGILVVAAVVFVFWAHPTGMVVFWFVVVVLAAFAIREFLAPRAAADAESGSRNAVP